jgi:hypothetical protein
LELLSDFFGSLTFPGLELSFFDPPSLVLGFDDDPELRPDSLLFFESPF